MSIRLSNSRCGTPPLPSLRPSVVPSLFTDVIVDGHLTDQHHTAPSDHFDLQVRVELTLLTPPFTGRCLGC